MYSITSKLYSTFGTIGEATADKMTAKVFGNLKLLLKREEFYLNLNMLSFANIEHFDLLDRFFSSS